MFIKLIESHCCTRKCCSNFHAVFYAHFSKTNVFCVQLLEILSFFTRHLTQHYLVALNRLIALSQFFSILPHTFPNNENKIKEWKFSNSSFVYSVCVARWINMWSLFGERCLQIFIFHYFIFFCCVVKWIVDKCEINNTINWIALENIILKFQFPPN